MNYKRLKRNEAMARPIRGVRRGVDVETAELPDFPAVPLLLFPFPVPFEEELDLI